MRPLAPVAQTYDPWLAALRTAQRVALTNDMTLRRTLGLLALVKQQALLLELGHAQVALLARCVLTVNTR